jgi:putative membrane protein
VTLAPTPSRSTGPRQPRWRGWAGAAGVAVVAAAVLPPVLALARRYVVAESAQFAVFAMAGPALLVAGAPWRLLRAWRAPGELAAARRGRPSFLRAGAFLATFVAVSLAWRLPPVVDALAAHPALLAAELLSLLAVGTGLWLELVPSPPLAPRLPHPQRAAIAALAMWSTWAAAYVVGLSNGAVFHGYDPPGSALSPVADQELTVALVWAVAAVCFVPVVFVTLLAWLRRGEDPDEELPRITRDASRRPVVRGWGRASRDGKLSSR